MVVFLKNVFSRFFFLLFLAIITGNGIFFRLQSADLFYLKGPYPVGAEKIFFEDKNRQDPYRDNRCRIIGIDLWYPINKRSPINKENKKRIRYQECGHTVFEQHIQELDAGKKLFAEKKYERPGIFIDNYEHSSKDYLQQKMPLVILLHGYTMSAANYTSLALSLASHGSCVVALTLPGIAGCGQFNDNFFITSRAQASLETFFCYEADVLSVIGALGDKNLLPHQLNQYADKEQISLIGHSMGGAIATRLAALNDRVSLVINMDGPLFGRALFPRFNKPCLFMLAGDFYEEFSKRKELLGVAGVSEQEFRDAIPSLCKELGNNGYLITFKNAGHNSFSDFSLYHSYWEKTMDFSEQETLFWRKHLRIEKSFSSLLMRSFIKKIIDFCNKHQKESTYFVSDDFCSEYSLMRSKY